MTSPQKDPEHPSNPDKKTDLNSDNNSASEDSDLPLSSEKTEPMTHIPWSQDDFGKIRVTPRTQFVIQQQQEGTAAYPPTEDMSRELMNHKKDPLVEEALQKYAALEKSEYISCDYVYEIGKKIGSGGQGEVFKVRRRGVDGFNLSRALKFLSPESFETMENYENSMLYSARVATRVGRIQHDNLLSILNWEKINGIRIMEMEWIDGYNLNQLTNPRLIPWMREHLPAESYKFYLNVIVSKGQFRHRLKTGIALEIMRSCLLALDALHSAGIIHGDIKPENIMLKRTGQTKIIDLGAAFFANDPPLAQLCSPFHAAPEMLRSHSQPCTTFQSDLASLGYVLIDLLSGCSPMGELAFASHPPAVEDIYERKMRLPDIMEEVLPAEVTKDTAFVEFCRKMIHPDLSKRFQNAREALTDQKFGLTVFSRALIKADLASVFDYDIHSWVSSLRFDPDDDD